MNFADTCPIDTINQPPTPNPCSTFAEDFTGVTISGYQTGSYTINGNDWTPSDAGNTSYATQILGSGTSAITINDDRVEANITTPLLNSVGTVSF